MEIEVCGERIVKEGHTRNGIPNGYDHIMSFKRDEERLLAKWTRFPETFMVEAMGLSEENGLQLSPHQQELMLAVGDMAFAKKLLWDNQKRLERVHTTTRVWAKKTGISVRAGKGIRKTASEALLVAWFLFTHRNAKIPIVGPTEDHLRRVLWAEFHKWLTYRNEHTGEYIVAQVVRDTIKADSEKIYFMDKEVPDSWGKQWFAFPKVAAKNADKNITRGILSGLHEDNLFVIFDEAAGIGADEVFEPLENTLTGRCNFCLMTFNPNRNNGYAHDSHRDSNISKGWIPLAWNAEEEPEFVIPKTHIEAMAERYGGRDTNNYRVNVMGEFPTADDGSLIPYIWIQNAVERPVVVEKDLLPVMGLDVARDGGDATIACVRHGYDVKGFFRINKIDSDDVAVDAIRLAKKHEVGTIFVDSIGVGAGVYDRLRKYFPKIVGVKVSEAAKDTTKFNRLRDELWWKCRKRFESGLISIPNNKDLIEQLSSVQYSDQVVGGKIKVESKDSMRKRLGGESPDYADALNLTFYYEEDIGNMMSYEAKKTKWQERFEKEREEARNTSWMSA